MNIKYQVIAREVKKECNSFDAATALATIYSQRWNCTVDVTLYVRNTEGYVEHCETMAEFFGGSIVTVGSVTRKQFVDSEA